MSLNNDLRINYYPLVCSSVKENKDSKVVQRSSHAMGGFHLADTDLHLIHGGENSSKTFNTVLMFNAQDQSFTDIETANSPFLTQHTLTISKDNKYAYIFGGKDYETDSVSNNLYILNIDNRSFTKISTSISPPPRGCHVSQPLYFPSHSSNTFLLIHGGYNEDNDLNDLWIFDPEKISWQQIPTPKVAPSPRCMHSLTMISDNSFLLFGGKDVDNEYPGDLWRLDVTVENKQFKVEWNKIKTVAGSVVQPPELAGHSAALVVDQCKYLSIFGGETLSGKNSNKLYLLNLETLWWSQALYASDEQKGPKVTGHSMCYLNKVQQFIIVGGEEAGSSNSKFADEKSVYNKLCWVLSKSGKRKKMFVSPLVVRYEEYYNHFLYYDVIIQVENPDEMQSSPPIYCQRSILQDRASYFRGLVNSNMIESTSGIIAMQGNYDIVLNVIKYIYRVPWSEVDVLEMYSFANQLLYLDLRTYCAELLINEISPINIREIAFYCSDKAVEEIPKELCEPIRKKCLAIIFEYPDILANFDNNVVNFVLGTFQRGDLDQRTIAVALAAIKYHSDNHKVLEILHTFFSQFQELPYELVVEALAVLFEKFRDKEYIGNPININNSAAHLLLIEQLLVQSNIASYTYDLATTILSTLFFLFSNNSALVALHHIHHWKNILLAVSHGKTFSSTTNHTLWKYVEQNPENLTAALLTCSMWNKWVQQYHQELALPCSQLFINNMMKRIKELPSSNYIVEEAGIWLDCLDYIGESPVPLVSADMLDSLYTWYLNTADEPEISRKILTAAKTLSMFCDRVKMLSLIDQSNKRSVQFILSVLSSYYERYSREFPQNIPREIDLEHLTNGIFKCINSNNSLLLVEYLYCLYCLEKTFKSECLVKMDLIIPLADHIKNEDNELVIGYFFTILNIIKHSFEDEVIQLLQDPKILEKSLFLHHITTNTIFALSCSSLQEFCFQ